MLFEEAAKRYMDEKSRRLRACTLEGYRSALRCHLHPRWDGVELEGIEPEDIQGWVDSFELPGAAAKAYKTLRQIIRWSIRRLKLRMYDPTMAGIELPRMRPYSPAVMDAGGVRSLRRGRTGWLCELAPDAVARRIRSACKRAGAPWASMTNCRHTWATMAVEAGVGIETVAMMLGHADISTAYEHYIVPRAGICRDAQKQVERLIMAAG